MSQDRLREALRRLSHNTDFQVVLEAMDAEIEKTTRRALTREGTQCYRAQGRHSGLEWLRDRLAESMAPADNETPTNTNNWF